MDTVMTLMAASPPHDIERSFRPSTWLSLALFGMLLVLTRSSSATDVPDESPHWDETRCESSDLNGQVESCTDCHVGKSIAACLHPTDFPIRELAQLAIPDSYQSALADDNIVCTSCHSLQLQCEGGRHAQYQNPAFLRNGPFRQPSQVCFECHNNDAYKKLNPHQPASSGDTKSCLFCHDIVSGPEGNADNEYRLSEGLQCTGCHVVSPHPLSMAPGARTDSWTHLVVPTPEVVNHMRIVAARTGIVLPLDPDEGAINCATCHNPHDPDLQLYPFKTESGAESKLRMLDICEACHDK